MKKRRLERVAVMILSIAMLLSSTGIMSSLAANVGESSPASTSKTSETGSTTVAQEGGVIAGSTVSTEGGSLVTDENGDGTLANPYKISDADDFLKMQDKINLTTSSDKNFVLTADIDLLTVTEDTFIKNGGCLVKTSEKCFFTLNGNGHKIKGLDVKVNSAENISIFGCINAKSTVKNLTVENPKIVSKSDKLVSVAVIAIENKGVITNVNIINPVVNAEKCSYAAIVTATNNGMVSGVAVKGGYSNAGASTAEKNSISAEGTVGSVAAVNNGTISAVSVINVGMFIPETKNAAVYGGIAGRSTGKISDSIVTGTVCGGKFADIAGGVVGKAVKDLKLTNNYVLVSLSKSVQGGAVIGSSGSAEMIKDCYWSATVSKRSVPVTDFGANVNNLIANSFKVVTAGKSVQISAADVKKTTWGKTLFSLNGKFTSNEETVTISADGTTATVKGAKADTVTKVSFVADVTLPATVGAGTGSTTVKQFMDIYVLTVPENVKGDGSEASPLEITNSAEFGFLKYAVNLNCKLTKDIVSNDTVDYFCGSLDGNGHTVSTSGTLFNAMCGNVKNLDVAVTENISRGVFANVCGAAMSNVSVALNSGVKLNANSSNVGIFANKIVDKCTLDNCRVKGKVEVKTENLNNVGGFAGVVSGKETTITNSGACVDISGKKADAVNFIGTVAAENISLENCYVAGANASGKYAFAGEINAKAINVKNIYMDDIKKNALDFEKNTIIDKAQFTEWTFDEGNAGFFTGNGGKFTATLPEIKAFGTSKASDYKVDCDSKKIMASVAVENGKLILSVTKLNGVVTVKAVPVTVTNEKTGLSAVIYVSNGLEKDADGNWIVSNGFDLAYISENIEEMANGKFVVSNNIDMSVVKDFASIGSTAVAFSGTFNGNGYTISNLTVSGTVKTALFGVLCDATVKNVKLVNADVNSQGGYGAVLVGQATGKSVISDITVENSTVKVNDNYAAVVVAAIDNADGVKISDITVNNSNVQSSASYVGAVAGRITENTVVSDIYVNGFKTSGATFVSGVVGVAQSMNATTISNAEVVNSAISGVDQISGIASGIGNGVAINNAQVKKSRISTASGLSSFTAGGISALYGSTVTDVKVVETTVSAGVVGGVVGKTTGNCKLVIKNAEVTASTVNASEENSVAAGILAVHNLKGTAAVQNSTVSDDTVINGVSITAGVVGDCFGADSSLEISGVKSFATVNGGENAIAVAGIVGRTGANNSAIKNSVAGGIVNGSGVLGGIIGLVKNGEAYNGTNSIISDTVAYAQLKSVKAEAGMIIGGVEAKKILTSDDLDKAVSNVIISTYFGNVAPYSQESKLSGGVYVDVDKPEGKSIKASLDTLSTLKNTEVEISNLPKLAGFVFDTSTGWLSESEDRIQVVSCTENSVVLKANHQADISIIGYYISDKDSQVRVPVHFEMKSDVRTPLKGNGTKADPYLVGSAYDLETVAQYDSKDAYFALAEDISFTPADFEFGGAFYNVGNGMLTIGDVTNGFKGTFTGLYNGKVHSVSGLAVAGNVFGGLFGATDGAVISDLVINGANVSGLNYAGVVAGSAKDTTIKNITINGATVNAVELGGYAGSVVGFAENTIIENVTVNGAEIKTVCESDGMAVDFVGGLSGIFSGSVKDVTLDKVTVETDCVAGGLFGAVRDGATVKNAEINAHIKAEIAAGVVGRLDNPLKFSVDGCNISGTVEGTKVSAGVIGKIDTDDASLKVSKCKAPLVANTLIIADLKKSDICGIVIGDVSEKIITEDENTNTDVFSNVYYSSYQNNIAVFGNEKINAYQSDEYKVTDLNNIKFVDAVEKDYLPLGSRAIRLGDNSIKLNGAKGSYKFFTVNGKSFELQSIKADKGGNIAFDLDTSSIKLTSSIIEGEKAIFEYNDGLKLAIPVGQESEVKGLGTESDPYVIANADDFAAMLQNAAAEDVYYALTSDISLKGVASTDLFAGVLEGNGYVLYDFTGSGLFGRVTGEIRNTGFAAFNVSDNKSVAVGAVAGVIDGGKVADCFVIADVNANGKKQDAGILAGRAINGAEISGVLVSGTVYAENSIAAGGLVGIVSDSVVENVTSTAYVKGGSATGGIAGELLRSEIKNAVFGNMVESVSCGNIAGATDKASTIRKSFFDASASRTNKAVGSGEKADVTAKTTAQLKALSLNGFKTAGGYPVPENLTKYNNAKFATGVAFASTTINYLAGLGAGTVYNYTDVSVAPEVNGNEIKLDKADGITLTLVSAGDYADAENRIARYTNPLSTSSVDINCSFVDATSGKLGSKLVGVLLKSKSGDNSSAFDFFAKANAQAKNIGSVVVTDGKLYVNAELPQGVKFTVSAVDENGRSLAVNDIRNEGVLVKTGSAKTVSIVITAENNEENIWGLRSLWSVIGK